MSIQIAREQGPLPGFTVGAMEDTMRYWLGVVCREQREQRGRLQVHVAASLDRNQSTIARFERGEGWPQDPDIAITAYADDLEMDAIELWELALTRWRDEGHQPKLVDLKKRRGSELEERRAKRAGAGRRHPEDAGLAERLAEIGHEPTTEEPAPPAPVQRPKRRRAP